LLGSTDDQTYSVAAPSGPNLTEIEPDITSSPTATTVQLPQTATFSGVAVEASGVPVGSGTFVSLLNSSRQAVADAQVGPGGSFSFQAPPGVYTVEVDDVTSFSGQRAGLDLTVPGGVDLTQGSVSQDITMPAVTSFQVSVVDANGAPVQGAEISQRTDQFVSASGWSGGPVGTAELSSIGTAVCFTDSSGACSIPALLGSTDDQTYSVAAPSGPNLTEIEPDITSNPTTTTVPINSYVSLTSAGASGGSFSLSSPASAQITDASVASVPPGSLPPGAIALVGALSYTVTGLTPGSTADITITLPAGSAPSAVYKDVGGQYADVTSLATISGSTITLHITDGGLGDADGTANGTIVDPIVPVKIGLVNSAPPVISGSPRYLGKLTSTAGSWATANPLTFHYQWQQCTSDGMSCTNIAGATHSSYIPSSADIGHLLEIVVSAADAQHHTGQATAMTAVVTPAVQKIRFTTRPQSPAYGGTYAVGATGGGSGNPVTFSIDAASTAGACTISGQSVSFASAGSCIIDAQQAGNANYQPAQSTQTIVIHLAKLAVIANPQSRSVGAPNPPLTAHITGFVNGQTLANSGVTGTPHCTTTARTISPAGTYPISCSRGTLSATPGTYTFTFLRSQLTVS
jgi:hypothetical protein